MWRLTVVQLFNWNATSSVLTSKVYIIEQIETCTYCRCWNICYLLWSALRQSFIYVFIHCYLRICSKALEKKTESWRSDLMFGQKSWINIVLLDVSTEGIPSLWFKLQVVQHKIEMSIFIFIIDPSKVDKIFEAVLWYDGNKSTLPLTTASQITKLNNI